MLQLHVPVSPSSPTCLHPTTHASWLHQERCSPPAGPIRFSVQGIWNLRLGDKLAFSVDHWTCKLISILNKVHIRWPNGPAILFLGIYSKKLKYILKPVHVCSSIIHNSQKVETTQVTINRWINKQNVVYPYNEKEWSTEPPIKPLR